ncbi:MAG TPA: hypothetical protein VF144_02985 [Chitinophagaceae bacterium]
MKKVIFGLGLIIVFLVVSIYLFIPAKIKIYESVPVKGTVAGVSRLLSNDSSWHEWWPEEPTFHYDGRSYLINGHFFNAFDLSVIEEKDSLDTRMNLVPYGDDSMSVDWSLELFTGTNPFKRFSQYKRAKEIKKDLHTILISLKKFAEVPENIYGIVVRKTIVQDSVLISTRRSFDHKPGPQEIDVMIQKLKDYIKKNAAVEKNFPMLNVSVIDSADYQAMVAIPVDRELPATEEFAPKFLLKNGNILEVQIQGGLYTIEKAFTELENYRDDYKHTSPAIPYQLLVTDRLKEPDTTKWITKLYYPIF